MSCRVDRSTEGELALCGMRIELRVEAAARALRRRYCHSLGLVMRPLGVAITSGNWLAWSNHFRTGR